MSQWNTDHPATCACGECEYIATIHRIKTGYEGVSASPRGTPAMAHCTCALISNGKIVSHPNCPIHSAATPVAPRGTPPPITREGIRELVSKLMDAEYTRGFHRRVSFTYREAAATELLSAIDSLLEERPRVAGDTIPVPRRELLVLLLSSAVLARTDAAAMKIYKALKKSADGWLASADSQSGTPTEGEEGESR